jgi:hypothetical protein
MWGNTILLEKNHAVETITPEILQRVWQEFDYHIGVCRVTKGAHIEAL